MLSNKARKPDLTQIYEDWNNEVEVEMTPQQFIVFNLMSYFECHDDLADAFEKIDWDNMAHMLQDCIEIVDECFVAIMEEQNKDNDNAYIH